MELQVDAVAPLTCQRCLGTVDVVLAVRRSYRFVADEAAAQALDAQIEDDVLVTSRSFDLQALVEDELLLHLPIVALHDVCPDSATLRDAAAASVVTDAPGADKDEHPFAALASLRKPDGRH